MVGHGRDGVKVSADNVNLQDKTYNMKTFAIIFQDLERKERKKENFRFLSICV
jgi:hypothetical protein